VHGGVGLFVFGREPGPRTQRGRRSEAGDVADLGHQDRGHTAAVPIETFWVTTGPGGNFEIHVCDGEQRVTVLVFIPVDREYGSRTGSRSWTVRVGGYGEHRPLDAPRVQLLHDDDDDRAPSVVRVQTVERHPPGARAQTPERRGCCRTPTSNGGGGDPAGRRGLRRESRRREGCPRRVWVSPSNGREENRGHRRGSTHRRASCRRVGVADRRPGRPVGAVQCAAGTP
jgi:hypothetical protein